MKLDYLEALDMGYTNLREIAGQTCGLHGFIFTTGLVVGLDSLGYRRRYCFEDATEARKALDAWDGTGHPSGPWIKVKGDGIDMLNPELRA